MEGITANGPEYTSCKIGFDGRETPKGFWLNNVPWIPYSIDQFHSKFLPDVDMRVLGFILPMPEMSHYIVEHTWPFSQWAIPDMDGSEMFDVLPEDFGHYRSDMTEIIQWCRESMKNCESTADGYLAELVKFQLKAA